MTKLLLRLLRVILFVPAAALTGVLLYLFLIFGGLAFVIRWVATGKDGSDAFMDFVEDVVILPITLVAEIGG